MAPLQSMITFFGLTSNLQFPFQQSNHSLQSSRPQSRPLPTIQSTPSTSNPPSPPHLHSESTSHFYYTCPSLTQPPFADRSSMTAAIHSFCTTQLKSTSRELLADPDFYASRLFSPEDVSGSSSSSSDSEIYIGLGLTGPGCEDLSQWKDPSEDACFRALEYVTDTCDGRRSKRGSSKGFMGGSVEIGCWYWSVRTVVAESEAEDPGQKGIRGRMPPRGEWMCEAPKEGTGSGLESTCICGWEKEDMWREFVRPSGVGDCEELAGVDRGLLVPV